MKLNVVKIQKGDYEIQYKKLKTVLHIFVFFLSLFSVQLLKRQNEENETVKKNNA